ncbi:hypothetical protein BDR04DRAFT_1158780 [Suillus decipiens]|nr:hypothetical protein BDR04DRAFT_1158780 [Suillus decipiens]
MAIATVATVIVFHQFFYEPHIAPAIERWVEDFLVKRQARHPTPVPFTRGSGHEDPGPSGADPKKRTLAGEDDSVELQGYKLDEWRSQVHRTTQSEHTTIDESFPSLTPTYVISNISSPFTEILSVSIHTPTPTLLLTAQE